MPSAAFVAIQRFSTRRVERQLRQGSPAFARRKGWADRAHVIVEWWYRWVTPGCAGNKDLSPVAARALALINEPR